MPPSLPLPRYSSSSLYTETQKNLSLGLESTILLLVVAIKKANVKYLSNLENKWQKWRGGRKIQRAGKLDIEVLKSLFSCMRIWWIKRYCHKLRSFPGDSVVKDPPAKAVDAGDAFSPWNRKMTWRRSAPVFLLGKFQRSLVGCSPCGHKESDQLSN